MSLKSIETIIKISELGLTGDATALVALLKKMAAQEASGKRYGVYNALVNLIEKFESGAYGQIQTSSLGNEPRGRYSVNSEDLWLPERIQRKLEKFIKLQEGKFSSHRGVHNLNKLLLYGPPGSGKTTLGFYIAKKLKKEIRYIKVSDVISSRLGETTKNIEDIFKNAENQMIFIDEFDALAKKRTDNNDVGELKRVVNSIIQILDFHGQNSIVVVSTNLIESLDPAILRRFGYKMSIDYLSEEQLKSFFEFLILKEKDTEIKISKKEMSNLTELALLAKLRSIDDIKLFFDKTVVSSLLEGQKTITLLNFIKTAFDEDYIGGESVKDLKKNHEIELRKLCRYLEKNKHSKIKIAEMLGIHRNSYKKYAEKV